MQEDERTTSVSQLSEFINCLNNTATGLDLMTLKHRKSFKNESRQDSAISLSLDPHSWKSASEKVRLAIDELRWKSNQLSMTVSQLNVNTNANNEDGDSEIYSPQISYNCKKKVITMSDYKAKHRLKFEKCQTPSETTLLSQTIRSENIGEDINRQQTLKLIDKFTLNFRAHALTWNRQGEILTAKCLRNVPHHSNSITKSEINNPSSSSSELCEHDMVVYDNRTYTVRNEDASGSIIETDFSLQNVPTIEHRNCFRGNYPHITATFTTAKLLVTSKTKIIVFNLIPWSKWKTIKGPLRKTGHIVCRDDNYVLVSDPETRQVHEFQIEDSCWKRTWNFTNIPGSMCVDMGIIYVADSKQSLIFRLDDGGIKVIFEEKLDGIIGLAAGSGYLYVLHNSTNDNTMQVSIFAQ